MCSKKRMPGYIEEFLDKLSEAEAVMVGAGAGLSVSAGFTYAGKRFEENFADFIRKYKFRDMYSAGFFPFETPEEYWAYWSRYIYINRYQEPPKPVYRDLLRLIKDKDYFVLTTNVDHCFQKAGFDKNRLFYTQGDYGLWQCSVPCCRKTYDNKDAVYRMIEQQRNRKVPEGLIPHCPVCGRPMSMNLRADSTFVEDEGWQRASERYMEFLEKHEESSMLFLELGVGTNTPGIIKYSFWQMAFQWKEAAYVCINLEEAYAPKELEGKCLCIKEDIGLVLAESLEKRMREST